MAQQFLPWSEPESLNDSNIVPYLREIRMLYNPIEQARWTQSNVDSLFYAGEQRYINNYFQFAPSTNYYNFYFNFLAQPVNMVTGYQRQHRKSITYIPVEGSSQEYADNQTKLEMYANSKRRRLEKFSQGCEYAAIQGMCLGQPYLDFRGDDPINGELDLKIWAYNSFFIDPFFRETGDMSDCNFVWTQSYISRNVAYSYFPDKKSEIRSLPPQQRTEYSFYFLPENYNSARNNFLIMSQFWYRATRKKKFLYNRNDGITYDFVEEESDLHKLLQMANFFEVIEMEVPTWKLAVILNDKIMYHGNNPLKFDECPFVPIFWNYDPYLSQPDLRVRSLVRAMRDTQFLLNRRVIINHDISESSINSGYKRKENAVVNEEDLKYSGQGKDIIIKQENEMTDVEKIVPNAVPSSDMELANQLADFIFRTSGVNQELMGMSPDSDTGIQEMLRQGAGLVTLQKFFDQWDVSLKSIGAIDMKIMQYNWSASKISRIIGKEAPLEYQAKIFPKYSVLIEEGLNTTIQQQYAFVQALNLNEKLGGVIPPKYILENSTLQNKQEIIQAIEEQMQQAQQVQQQEALLKQTLLEAQVQNLQAKSVAEVGLAHERTARQESNLGLLSERMSQISKNRASAIKDKADAIRTLLDVGTAYSNTEINQKQGIISQLENEQIIDEEVEEEDAQNEFNEALFAAKLDSHTMKNLL